MSKICKHISLIQLQTNLSLPYRVMFGTVSGTRTRPKHRNLILIPQCQRTIRRSMLVGQKLNTKLTLILMAGNWLQQMRLILISTMGIKFLSTRLLVGIISQTLQEPSITSMTLGVMTLVVLKQPSILRIQVYPM